MLRGESECLYCNVGQHNIQGDDEEINPEHNPHQGAEDRTADHISEAFLQIRAYPVNSSAQTFAERLGASGFGRFKGSMKPWNRLVSQHAAHHGRNGEACRVQQHEILKGKEGIQKTGENRSQQVPSRSGNLIQ